MFARKSSRSTLHSEKNEAMRLFCGHSFLSLSNLNCVERRGSNMDKNKGRTAKGSREERFSLDEKLTGIGWDLRRPPTSNPAPCVDRLFWAILRLVLRSRTRFSRADRLLPPEAALRLALLTVLVIIGVYLRLIEHPPENSSEKYNILLL